MAIGNIETGMFHLGQECVINWQFWNWSFLLPMPPLPWQLKQWPFSAARATKTREDPNRHQKANVSQYLSGLCWSVMAVVLFIASAYFIRNTWIRKIYIITRRIFCGGGWSRQCSGVSNWHNPPRLASSTRWKFNLWAKDSQVITLQSFSKIVNTISSGVEHNNSSRAINWTKAFFSVRNLIAMTIWRNYWFTKSWER